jgi:hypothetical protein
MSKPSDLFIPSVSVRFCEILPLQMLQWSVGDREVKDLHFGLASTSQDNIRRKYVYVFSSSGSIDYGIDRSTSGWSTRSRSYWSRQHMAMLDPAGVNPKPSKAPNPDQVDMEIYVDHQGRMWPVTITKNWETPRHERPDPFWGKRIPTSTDEEEARVTELAARGIVGFDWLQLPLSDASHKPKRYYFLLSPFRLGPAGLKAALKDIGTDGLSLWFDPAVAAKDGRILGPDPEALKACGQTVIPIVDPYNYGFEIHHRLFERSLDAYLQFVGNAKKGKIPGLDPRHFDEAANGGTIDDLYFIAGVLANLKASGAVDDEIDMLAVDEVLGGYGWQLQRNAASCEVAARFLGNWMTGPAHAILDRAAIEDLDKPEDAFGKDDKAGVLLYWWHKLRLLPNTMTGAVAARQILSDTEKTFDNPLRFLFRKFEKPGKRLDLESNEGKAAQQLSDILPDIVFLSLLRFDPSEFKSADELDPEKAEERAGRIANIINNLGFLDTKVVNLEEYKKQNAAKEFKDLFGSEGKNFAKGGLYLLDGAGKFTVQFMKRALEDAMFGFQADQLEKIKEIKDHKGFDTLGKQLKEATRQSEAEIARLSDAIRKAEGDAIALAESVEATRKSDMGALEIARDTEVAQARRDYLKDKVQEIENKVKADEKTYSSITQSTKSKYKLASSTRLKQSRLQLEKFSEELREIDARLAGNADKIKNLTAQQRAKVEELTKDLEGAKAKGAAANKQLDAENMKLAPINRQSQALDKLVDEKNFAKFTKDKVPRAFFFISILSLGVEMIFAGATFSSRSSSKSDIGWATGDLAKAMADLGKDYLKVGGTASAEWAKATGATTFLKVRSTLTLSNATGVMSVLGVIGGAYNVVKYGAKGIDAYTMDDGTVGFGASLAVAGGVLGVVSAMGMTALGLTASGVGVLGGILVAAGGIIVAVTVDSEWEYFADHCYFARDPGDRNERAAGKGEDHWLGKMAQPSGGFLVNGRWSVRAQRDALVRLLSRYSVTTLGGLNNVKHYKVPTTPSLLTPQTMVLDMCFSATCVIDFQCLPVGASFEMTVSAFQTAASPHGQVSEWPEIVLLHRKLEADEMNSGTETVYSTASGKPVKVGRLGKFAGHERPGFLCVLLEHSDFTAIKELKIHLKTALSLPDGSKIVGEHLIAEAKVSPYGCEHEAEMGVTLVEKTEGAVDRGF